jgi:hypothetical protein
MGAFPPMSPLRVTCLHKHKKLLDLPDEIESRIAILSNSFRESLVWSLHVSPPAIRVYFNDILLACQEEYISGSLIYPNYIDR